jgi:hypothetical protein
MGTKPSARRELVVIGRVYWNIKGCGHMVRDFDDKFCEVSSIRVGAFPAIAPQMRHTKKREDQP